MWSMNVNQERFNNIETAAGFIRSALSNLFFFRFEDVAANMLVTTTYCSVVRNNMKTRKWLQIEAGNSISRERMIALLQKMAWVLNL